MAEQGFDDTSKSVYPARYIQDWNCRDGRLVTLRPICQEDKLLEKEFIEHLSVESSRFRFFETIAIATPEMLTQFCNIDYVHEMAIIAEYNSGGEKRNVGVGRLIIEHDTGSGEFAIVVADDFQANGLGTKLLNILINIGRERELKSIYGIVMQDNWKMIRLAKKLGFTQETSLNKETKVTREL